MMIEYLNRLGTDLATVPGTIAILLLMVLILIVLVRRLKNV